MSARVSPSAAISPYVQRSYHLSTREEEKWRVGLDRQERVGVFRSFFPRRASYTDENDVRIIHISDVIQQKSTQNRYEATH